ncbi:MAG: tetratricopeptide repeat protein [Bacteroidota bacterium]|nr:tetratricopeptide repeat protein [Bacteroidota bacterium]
MADKKKVTTDDNLVVERAKDFWTKYNRPFMIGSAVIILGAVAYFGYKNFIKAPKEEKATEDIFKAEEYYRMDSLQQALNGDGRYYGFLKVIDKYGGTAAANLAHYYAGDIYIKLGDNAKAVKHLKDFSTSSKMVQARAYKLLGDAYADLGKYNDALSYYKKAANHFTEDETNSSEYLFMAAYLAHKTMNKPKEAIELYKELKEKYPRTEKGFEAEKYLAQLGVYNTGN